MIERDEFRVSCKAALFTDDFSQVLLAQYAEGHYGLPGGHIEPEDDSPEAAAIRELDEEFGIKNIDLELMDSWFHDNGKLIIGYRGIIDRDTPITVQLTELADAKWTPVHKIESGEVVVRSYGKFILKCAGLSGDASKQFAEPVLQTGHQSPSA